MVSDLKEPYTDDNGNRARAEKLAEVRERLAKQMQDKNTTDVIVNSGDGYTAHVLERYADTKRPHRSTGPLSVRDEEDV